MLARAMGAEVTLFSRSPGKEADARRLGAHGITSDVEVIRIQDINEACERLRTADVKYRFVIDMASLKDEAAA